MNYERPDLLWYYRIDKYGIYVAALPDEDSEEKLKEISKKLKIKDYDNYHVTISYSKWGDLSYVPNNLTYSADCMEFDLFGEDKNVLVIRLASPELEARHAILRNKGHRYDFPEYLPHVTISENWDKELPDSSILYENNEPITLMFDTEYGEPLS